MQRMDHVTRHPAPFHAGEVPRTNPAQTLSALATIGWLGLTIVVFLGTVAVPLSGMLFARKITVGPAFYNHALMPVGIILLLTTAAAPALRWGAAVKPSEGKALFIALLIAVLIVFVAMDWPSQSLL